MCLRDAADRHKDMGLLSRCHVIGIKGSKHLIVTQATPSTLAFYSSFECGSTRFDPLFRS